VKRDIRNTVDGKTLQNDCSLDGVRKEAILLAEEVKRC
jgi:hypothetical protein